MVFSRAEGRKLGASACAKAQGSKQVEARFPITAGSGPLIQRARRRLPGGLEKSERTRSETHTQRHVERCDVQKSDDVMSARHEMHHSIEKK
jgi:hypothetical protein